MKSQRDKPWQKNASSLLVVNSILAAISALVIQTLVTEPAHDSIVWLVIGAGALFLFILSAEKITEAFASDDVALYVRYCLPYNVGVLLLLVDVAGIIRHYAGLSNYWTALV